MPDILLLQPPAQKAAEPPLALGILVSALQAEGRSVQALDANLAAYQYLLDGERLAALAGPDPSTAVRRALKHRPAALQLLRSVAQLTAPRYATAVGYLNLLLGLWGAADGGERLTLGDYQHRQFSPFNPDHLRLFADGQQRTLFHDYFQRQLLPRIAAAPPKLISVTINYLHQVLPAFELAGLLRRRFPACQLVAGGGLVSSWRDPLQKQQLTLPPFDHLVFGPGERPLAELVAGRGRADYFLQNPAEVGFVPDFSFAAGSDYFAPQPVLPLNASRGCYWQNCLFCPEATTPVQPFSLCPQSFPELLLQLAAEQNVRHFHLTDNAIPPQTLTALAARGEALAHLNWFGFVRFERLLEDPRLCRELAQAGCRMLQLGLESGSQRVLDRLGKGIRLDTVATILHNLRAAGIASYVYIMLGTPGETRADAELTRQFLERHAAEIGFLNLSIMNLPRDSGLLAQPDGFGIAASELYDQQAPLGLYHSYQPTGEWDRTAARRFLAKQLLGTPAIREIAKRTPPIFSSNHAIFFAPARPR